MRPSISVGRALVTLGILATSSAQQTTVKAFIPYAGFEMLEQLYESFEADVLSTTGGAVVAAMDEKDYPIEPPEKRVTLTIGPHTFRQDFRETSVVVDDDDDYTTTSHYFYDCTFEGCPEPTTGLCSYNNGNKGVTETVSASGTTAFAKDEMTFGAFALATPLPEALEDECKEGGGDEGEDEDAESANDEDEDEDEHGDGEDKPDGAGRAAMSWLGLLPGLALGFAV